MLKDLRNHQNLLEKIMKRSIYRVRYSWTGGRIWLTKMRRNITELFRKRVLRRPCAESVQRMTRLLHQYLPDLESFNLTLEAAHGLPVSAADVWLPMIYGAGYVLVFLVVAN